mmetsp:Transcript_46498/g.123434  ORF Transcript_46498/g.123434 Transcript_46498/m.123434 type:complete len:94 (+) Transcript_46498:498-779(+)
MLAQPSFADRARKARIGQMLATPLTSLQPGCQGEEGKNRRLCELGVNVGDVVFGASVGRVSRSSASYSCSLCARQLTAPFALASSQLYIINNV